jgi:hypothetical protein
VDAQALDRLDDLREAVGEVIAIAGEEPDTALIPAGDDSESVVLDLVNPAGTGRRLLGRAWEAWFQREAMTQHEIAIRGTGEPLT